MLHSLSGFQCSVTNINVTRIAPQCKSVPDRRPRLIQKQAPRLRVLLPHPSQRPSPRSRLDSIAHRLTAGLFSLPALSPSRLGPAPVASTSSVRVGSLDAVNRTDSRGHARTLLDQVSGVTATATPGTSSTSHQRFTASMRATCESSCQMVPASVIASPIARTSLSVSGD